MMDHYSNLAAVSHGYTVRVFKTRGKHIMRDTTKDSIGTLVLYLLLTVGMLLSFSVSANSEIVGSQLTGEVLLLAKGGSCASKCEAAKKRCMAQNTVTNNYGVKMVTPDGAKRCWGAYHQCKSYCK